MPLSLSHKDVRELAKNLRELTGREFQHTKILEAIAKAVGRNADSLMHELKNETAAPLATVDRAPNGAQMVMQLGFSKSGKVRGRWTMTVLQRRDPNPALLEIVIEPVIDLRQLASIDPEDSLWTVKAIHRSKPLHEPRAPYVDRVVGSAGSTGLNLMSAINIAMEFIGTRHHLWSNADAGKAEFDLPELNPLAQQAIDLRNNADELESRRIYEEAKAYALMGADPESPIGKARLLGFKPQHDERGRGVLVNSGFIVSMQGPSWHLEIDNDHPSGSNAPLDGSNWRMNMVFSDHNGQLVAPVQQVLGDVTLEAAVAKADALHRNIAEVEEIWAKARSTNNQKENEMTPQDSIRIAEAAGFEIWHTGGGCRAFAKLLREVATPGDDVATMDLMITVEGGTSIDASPNDRVWGAGINYSDPRGGDSPRYTREDTFTLEEAIAKAREFEQQADEVWNESYDEDAIREHEDKRHRM